MIDTQAYANLTALSEEIRPTHLKTIFEAETNRFEHFSQKMDGIVLDFSKQKINQAVFDELINLAKECDLENWIQKLITGEPINHTEGRAAWHTASRNISNPLESVSEQWQKMDAIIQKLHAKQFRGFSGKPITDVVNIGVGGSDLGPLMMTHALDKDKHPDAPNVHFVSTLDARQLQKLLATLDPKTTLFSVASKSFTTIDTLSLAETAKEWMQQYAPSHAAIMRHFIGISTNIEMMSKWGILPDYQLQFEDWVGGRFSLWSTIGFSIGIKLGMSGYKEMLAGAHAMDRHYSETPLEQNIPVLLGLMGIWNTNFLDLKAQAILPYDSRLKYLPSYLEQLEMESNGKRTKRDGTEVTYRTCPILWGEVGPNAQHAFYQLLHQGTERVMSDFILFAQCPTNSERAKFHQKLNIANCLAQSRAMMIGQTSENLHKNYPGGQVSNTILLEQLDAYHLGMLVALYEHKVFTQSVIWDINAFDQWGVELGKKLALDILDRIDSHNTENLDASTMGILEQIWEQNHEN